jgi:acyl-CoA thioester hydrolase
MADVYSIQVPYYQVDQQGVVFNMWYFAWLDEAMSAFLASIGHPYDALIDSGADVQLVHSEIDWKGSARWGDDAVVEVTTAEVGRTSFTLEFLVKVKGEVIATAKTVYVVINTDGSGKRPVPEDLRAALEAAQH